MLQQDRKFGDYGRTVFGGDLLEGGLNYPAGGLGRILDTRFCSGFSARGFPRRDRAQPSWSGLIA